MSQAVPFTLIDFSSSQLLKQHFAKQRAAKLKQFEYLDDLRESGEFISGFIAAYPIPNQEDRKFIFEMVKSFPPTFQHLSEEYYSNVEFVKLCLEIGVWHKKREIPQEIENDKEFIRKALAKNIGLYSSLRNAQFTLQEIIQLPSVDKYFLSRHFEENDFLSLDRNILMDAIQRDLMREYNFENYDREIQLLILKQNRANFRFISMKFDWIQDEEALDALLFPKDTKYWGVNGYQHVSVLECTPELVGDRDFVMKIIVHDPKSFKYCSKELRADKEIALIAISKDKYQIEFIVPPLNNDREFMMEMVSITASFYDKASNELKSDRDFIIFALKSPGPYYAAQYVNRTLCQEDPEIRDLVIRTGHTNWFKDFSIFTRDQVIDCVRARGNSLTKFGNYLTDEEVLLACAESGCLDPIPLEKRTFELCMAAIEKVESYALRACEKCPFFESLLIEYAKKSTEFYFNLKDFKFNVQKFKEIIPYDKRGKFFEFAPEEIKNDREIALHYVIIDGKLFSYLCTELQKDPIIKKEAIKHGLIL